MEWLDGNTLAIIVAIIGTILGITIPVCVNRRHQREAKIRLTQIAGEIKKSETDIKKQIKLGIVFTNMLAVRHRNSVLGHGWARACLLLAAIVFFGSGIYTGADRAAAFWLFGAASLIFLSLGAVLYLNLLAYNKLTAEFRAIWGGEQDPAEQESTDDTSSE